MDAKRGSPLWVFAGGCLTGAALLGLHSRGGPESASTAKRADDSSDVAPRSVKAGSVEERARVEPAAAEVVTRAPSEAPDTAKRDAERDKAEDGNYVAEVLARLENEYRERSTPPPAPAPAAAAALPASDEPTPASSNEPPQGLAQAQEPTEVSAAPAPKLAASDPPAVVRAAAPAPEVASSDARVAALSVEEKPTMPNSEEASRLASISDEQAKALARGQEQLAQMQQLAALQQATLVEQYTLFQLQLLSQSPVASPTTVLVAPTRPQRRGKARGGRIVASLPSSISATDNPWGFDLQPSVLVR